MNAPAEYRVTTDDGRTLAGTGHGPENGRPVLFVAGAATGRTMAFGEDLLDDLGVRLLTMDRPGMGGSDVDDARTLSSTAADYLAFIRAVMDPAVMDPAVTGSAVTDPAARIPIVANSQGAVFGLALAIAGGARRLVLASPADEIAHPPIHAMLPDDATALADLARDDPDRAAQVLRGFSAQAMERMVLQGAHPDDARFYDREPFRSRYREALDAGFAGDGAGYVRDTLIAMRPWALDLATVACPVDILFGAHDHSHSPDHGATLAARIPGASRRILPDAGGALLWTHAGEVLEAALSEV